MAGSKVTEHIKSVSAHGSKVYPPVSSTGSGSELAVTIENFVLEDGASIRVKLNADLVSGAAINVSGTGAKSIITSDGKSVKEGPKADSYISLIYNGTDFVMQSEALGYDYGTEDLTAGTSQLETGRLYFVYE